MHGTNDRVRMVRLMGWTLREIAIDGAGMGKKNCSIVRIVLIVRWVDCRRGGVAAGKRSVV